MRRLNRLSVFVLFSTWKIKMTEMNNLYAVTFLDGSTPETWKKEGKKERKMFPWSMFCCLACPGCTDCSGMCSCLPALCCWCWIVWCMHVSCIDSDVHSCFELWSALSHSSWIRRYIRAMYYYYYYYYHHIFCFWQINQTAGCYWLLSFFKDLILKQ